MKVFISWSKSKSMKLAIATKNFLESSNSNIQAFVSEVDINGGEDVQKKIVEKIEECDQLVLCFTKENKRAPWLLFEAGYARGLQKTVIPILFDYDSTWHSWVDNPMNVARELKCYEKDFEKDFFRSFGLMDSNTNKNEFIKYRNAISNINETFKILDVHCEDLVEDLINNEAFVVKNPYFRDKSAFFLSGFESYDLMKIITQSFMFTGKYLWIYGRKNMKLFSGSFKFSR